MRSQKGNVLPIILGVLVVAFAVWVFFYVRDHHHDRGSTQTAAKSSTSPTSTELTSGSSDSDLNSDLQNINSDLNQGNQQLQNSNNALNDQQLPVTN
jgi:uncharacterized protein HemX